MGKKLIAPSILSADFARLADELKAIQRAGADLIHVDIMDGHFVPNITIGPDVVHAIRKHCHIPIDCHLMIKKPERYIEQFAEAGADMISVHVEACDLEEVLPTIKELGCRAGAVINPKTPLKKLLPYVELADYILVMTVQPGFGGQTIMLECIEKICKLRQFRNNQRWKQLIEVDGGIKVSNTRSIIKAGADILVAGSAIFKSGDYKKTIDAFRKAMG